MKQFWAILICLIMLISIIACGTSGEKSEGEKSGNSETTETTVFELKPNLPEKNFNGDTFTFATRGVAYDNWECFECFIESETGEPVNDAVYQRNMIIEDRYNVKIRETKFAANMEKTLYNSVMAGENFYNAVMLRGVDSAYLAENNVLLDLGTIKYIELSNPWWDQNSNKGFSIGGRIFFTACDIGYSDKDGSWIMAFNKRILDNNSLESPYNIVRDNRWTMDKLYEMGKVASKDLDGDGNMKLTDLWGIASESFDTYALLFAGGERIFKNNAEGYPELVVYNERSVQVVEKYMTMVKDKDNYVITLAGQSPFVSGRALFMSTTLYSVRLYWRDLDDDFGIIPVPKFDSNQEDFHHIVSIGYSGAMISVLMTSPNLELTGIILEDLAYESSKILIPTYVNTCYNNKFLRDAESIEMLKLLLGSRVFDFSISYNWGDWTTYFTGLTASSNVNLASEYEKRADKTREAMNQTIDIYKNLNK